MSFKLGDIVIDRLLYGVAEDFDGNLLYILTQLAEGTIDITAESKEARDKDGVLIKKFWTAKSGTFTANNAMLNTNIMEATSGTQAVYGTVETPVEMPRIIVVPVGSTATLTDFVEGTVSVCAMYNNGTKGDSYILGEAASETEFVVNEDGVLTLPTLAEDSDVTQFMVKYERKSDNGIAIANLADKFPQTVKLTLKALCVDPCEPDTLKGCYIVLPSFQVSPEVSIALQTDAQLEYKGDLQVAYCSGSKKLYEFFMDPDDDEE